MFELESCTRGFHVYYVLWMPCEGEVFHCAREAANGVVFCNVHCMLKTDDHFIIAIIYTTYCEYHNNSRIKLPQMTRHSMKMAKV